MPVYHRLNQAEVQRILRGDGVERDLLRRGRRVQGVARRLVKVDKGRLRASITVELRYEVGKPVVQIGSRLRYAIMVHDGTGIYGPRGVPITPRRGQFLVFTPKGSNQVVFARAVKGQRGVPYLRNALPAARL